MFLSQFCYLEIGFFTDDNHKMLVYHIKNTELRCIKAKNKTTTSCQLAFFVLITLPSAISIQIVVTDCN